MPRRLLRQPQVSQRRSYASGVGQPSGKSVRDRLGLGCSWMPSQQGELAGATGITRILAHNSHKRKPHFAVTVPLFFSPFVSLPWLSRCACAGGARSETGPSSRGGGRGTVGDRPEQPRGGRGTVGDRPEQPRGGRGTVGDRPEQPRGGVKDRGQSQAPYY